MAGVRRIAFVVFPRLTLLDLVGGWDALRRVPLLGIDPAVELRVIGTAAEIADESGLVVRPHGVWEDLAGFDLLYVPGGRGTRALLYDERFVAWLRTWGAERPIASVCTGALLLGAAGHLRGRRATTHHGAHDLLTPLCGEVVRDARVVEDGPVTTAAGVSAALDLGLHLVARHWGPAAGDRIAAQMEYPPR